MVKFSKELGSFLNSIGIPDIETKDQLAEYTQMTPRSSNYIKPGNILVFRYDQIVTVAFVVSTPKSGIMGGKYVSSKHNTLVTAFKLNDISDIVAQSIVTNLYMRPMKSRYTHKKSHKSYIKKSTRVIENSIGRGSRLSSSSVSRSLKTVLGNDKFRTYNLGKMYELRKLELPITTEEAPN